MMSDAMGRLAAANPVTEPPAVESAERLRRLIEDDTAAVAGGRSKSQGRPTGHRRVRGTRMLAGALLTIGAAAAGLLLLGGSSDSGLNVAAAAYAATSPRAGIVEAVFVARRYPQGRIAGATLRQQEWTDAATGQRRELNTLDEPHADPPVHQVRDWVFAPHQIEEWRHGASQLDSVRVQLLSRTAPSLKFENTILIEHTVADFKIHLAFGGIALDGIEGIELFRALYRKGLMRLVGHERHDGRLLWKLEGRPVTYDANGIKVTEHTRLVVLVDPRTFLPVSERQIDFALPGHPTVAESNLIRYRHLLGDQDDSKVFDLAAQHPGARVVTSSMIHQRSILAQANTLKRNLALRSLHSRPARGRR